MSHGWDGIVIDFEPTTDVHYKSANPTPLDALNFASLIEKVSGAMHRANKTLQLATQSVSSACMSSPCRLQPAGLPPDCNHTWNLRPCPWIRQFWNHNALALTSVDAAVPMDTYTLNVTEAPYDVWYMQKYWEIERINWGIWPDQSLATAAYAADRIELFESVGSTQIAVWVVGRTPMDNHGGPGGGWNLTAVETMWEPWLPSLEGFLRGSE
eukprot:COSAG04_NODE_4338_length_2149_cov_1.646341_1_plen_212_part_00